MRLSLSHRLGRCLVGCSVLLMGSLAGNERAGAEMASPTPSTVVTDVGVLRRLTSSDPGASHVFQMEGDVWWANRSEGRLVLHDDSGTEEIEMDLKDQPVKAGDRVRLTGSGTLARRGAACRLGTTGPVVQNDGVHSLLEQSGSVYLAAGRHPFRLDWFNGTGRFGLSLDYEGPGLPRQRIPDAALWRMDTDAEGGAGRDVHGVKYRCYEGVWRTLPDFSRLTPASTGTASNFDVGVRTRDNHVALQFTGTIEVPRDGLYRFHLKSDDGSRLWVGQPKAHLQVVGQATFPSPRPMLIGQAMSEEAGSGQWAQVEGKATFVRKQPEGLQLELRAGAGTMRIEVAGDAELSVEQLSNRRIRAVGFCQSIFNLEGEKVTGALLVPGGKEITLLPDPSGREKTEAAIPSPQALPLLTTASAVRELGAQEARRGYPVRIQGVVTCVQSDNRAFVIQDSTTGLYAVAAEVPRFDLPDVGEFLEVEGVTDEPGIARLRRVTRLGEGTLPEPVHAAWDQLLNGRLDSQWIEIGGLVENLIDRSNGWMRVMLRTRSGVLKVDVRQAGVKPEPLEHYENAVVRLRGCMFADWLPSMRLKVGQIRMYDVDVIVDQPPPADVFSLPITTAAALMRFDPAFGVSRRVKVAGQVVYVRGADYFIMDGNDGLRFMAKQPLGLAPGDLVEAVGYPELSGAAPVLRGAVARKTGHAALPEPRRLSPNDLILANRDATRVRVEGLLTGLKQTPTNLVLEMQGGPWRFLGRLNTVPAAAPALDPGSRLELTGVYCAQGGYAALGADFAPLDLLLNQPSDIRVLARPSWWTLRRLLVIVGLLACAVALMMLWITQLHRKVEERTAELATQIQHRQQVEHQRTMEQERARIAQDLHDQLGSDIATVSMLAARAQFVSAPDEKRIEYLDQVRAKAREMVAGLDEIVWAMNPGHDSLASLVSYLGRYADRFLGWPTSPGISMRRREPPTARWIRGNATSCSWRSRRPSPTSCATRAPPKSA